MVQLKAQGPSYGTPSTINAFLACQQPLKVQTACCKGTGLEEFMCLVIQFVASQCY